MKLLLFGVREFYLKGQFHTLKRAFKDGYVERENKKIFFSEIFNPVYLAINSLESGGKMINLAPEKEGIDRQIRDFSTAN